MPGAARRPKATACDIISNSIYNDVRAQHAEAKCRIGQAALCNHAAATFAVRRCPSQLLQISDMEHDLHGVSAVDVIRFSQFNISCLLLTRVEAFHSLARISINGARKVAMYACGTSIYIYIYIPRGWQVILSEKGWRRCRPRSGSEYFFPTCKSIHVAVLLIMNTIYTTPTHIQATISTKASSKATKDCLSASSND